MRGVERIVRLNEVIMPISGAILVFDNHGRSPIPGNSVVPSEEKVGCRVPMRLRSGKSCLTYKSRLCKELVVSIVADLPFGFRPVSYCFLTRILVANCALM